VIRLLVADDHALVRAGIKRLIDTTSDISIVAEVARGDDVLPLVRKRCQDLDVAILDLSLPGRGGIDILQDLATACPSLRVLVLSMHNEPQVVSRALDLGAKGYVTKDSDASVLLNGIRKIAAGERFVDPAIALPTTKQRKPGEPTLSSREQEVLQRLASGQSLHVIAEELGLSPKTVSTFKLRMMTKLCLDNNADLVRYTIQIGLASGFDASLGRDPAAPTSIK
jgi:DNA-binding NarL/FixJ family response regulator